MFSGWRERCEHQVAMGRIVKRRWSIHWKKPGITQERMSGWIRAFPPALWKLDCLSQSPGHRAIERQIDFKVVSGKKKKKHKITGLTLREKERWRLDLWMPRGCLSKSRSEKTPDLDQSSEVWRVWEALQWQEAMGITMTWTRPGPDLDQSNDKKLWESPCLEGDVEARWERERQNHGFSQTWVSSGHKPQFATSLRWMWLCDQILANGMRVEELPLWHSGYQIRLGTTRVRVQSLASLSGLRIRCCRELWCRWDAAQILHCCGCGAGQQLQLWFDP